MPTMTIERPSAKGRGYGFTPRPTTATFARAPRADPWAAHNNCAHIPNAETREAMKEGKFPHNLIGPFTTGEEMIAHMLKDD